MTISEALEKLSKSKFRGRFHLKKKDLEYIDRIGLEKIREHAVDFVSSRLAPAYIENEGAQTPTKGHPYYA